MLLKKHIFVLVFLMFVTCPAFAETPSDNQNSIETRVDLIKQNIIVSKEKQKLETELFNQRIIALEKRMDRDAIYVVGIFTIVVFICNLLGWSYIKKRINKFIEDKAYRKIKENVSDFYDYIETQKNLIRNKIDIDTPREESKKHLKAMKHSLDKVKEKNRYSAHDWFYEGVFEYRIKHLDKAFECFTAAIKLNPSFLLAYCNRGIIYSDRKEYDNAISDFKKTIMIDHGYISGYFNIAEFNILKGDYTSCLEIISKVSCFYNELSLKNKALLLFFDCSIKALFHIDFSEQDEQLRHILKQDFVTTWSFDELEQWISMPIDVDDETKKYIITKIANLKNKTRVE